MTARTTWHCVSGVDLAVMSHDVWVDRLCVANKIANRHMAKWHTSAAGTLDRDELVNVAVEAMASAEPTFNHAVPLEWFRLRIGSRAVFYFIMRAMLPIHFYTRFSTPIVIVRALRMSKIPYDSIGVPTGDPRLPSASDWIETTASERDLAESMSNALVKSALIAAVRTEMGIFASRSEKCKQAAAFMLGEPGVEYNDSSAEARRRYGRLNAMSGYYRKQMRDNKTLIAAADWLN